MTASDLGSIKSGDIIIIISTVEQDISADTLFSRYSGLPNKSDG